MDKEKHQRLKLLAEEIKNDIIPVIHEYTDQYNVYSYGMDLIHEVLELLESLKPFIELHEPYTFGDLVMIKSAKCLGMNYGKITVYDSVNKVILPIYDIDEVNERLQVTRSFTGSDSIVYLPYEDNRYYCDVIADVKRLMVKEND